MTKLYYNFLTLCLLKIIYDLQTNDHLNYHCLFKVGKSEKLFRNNSTRKLSKNLVIREYGYLWKLTKSLKIATASVQINKSVIILKARLHETRSELKLVWNIEQLWKVVPFTWQFHYGQPWDLKPLLKNFPFTWRFHCGNFPNRNKILMHMHKL